MSVIQVTRYVRISHRKHQVRLFLTHTPVDEVLVVDELNPPDHLIGQHENCFHCEASGAKVEQVFQTGTQQIHDQDVVIAFLTEPVHNSVM